MTKKRPAVDPKSYDLAEHFLQDHAHTGDEKWDLADTIQKAVEGWFDYHPHVDQSPHGHAMLPNDSHPGAGCSCADCLQKFPERA